MSLFAESDRPLLLAACRLACEARRPPLQLGQRPEPVWAALAAMDGREIASAAFSAGDSEDAVRKLLPLLAGGACPGATLYLTLEPKAGFGRLPPVTESVRRLGVKRVVIGTLDPAQRYRGEGKKTLERMGVEVALADGEEARQCQHLLEDYAKWLQKGVAVLQARVALVHEPDGTYDLKFAGEAGPLRADAVICRAGGPREEGGAWRIVLDPEGWERPSPGSVLYQRSPPSPGPGVRLMPMRDGTPDLGGILRDIATMGLLTAELSADPELFRLALRSGLIDSVLARFSGRDEWSPAFSQLERVRVTEGGSPLSVRLSDARLLDGQLEAGVELC